MQPNRQHVPVSIDLKLVADPTAHDHSLCSVPLELHM